MSLLGYHRPLFWIRIFCLSVSKGFWGKLVNRAQISSNNFIHSGVSIDGGKQLCPLALTRRAKEHWAQHRDGTRHKEIFFWESIVATISYLVHCDTLSQNVTNIIRKCVSYFNRKYDKGWLQNASGFLLPYAKVLLWSV